VNTVKWPFFELNQWLLENMKAFWFYRPYQKYKGGVAIELFPDCSTCHQTINTANY